MLESKPIKWWTHYELGNTHSAIYFRYLADRNLSIPWDTMNRMYFNFSVTTVTYRRLGRFYIFKNDSYHIFCENYTI